MGGVANEQEVRMRFENTFVFIKVGFRRLTMWASDPEYRIQVATSSCLDARSLGLDLLGRGRLETQFTLNSTIEL